MIMMYFIQLPIYIKIQRLSFNRINKKGYLKSCLYFVEHKKQQQIDVIIIINNIIMGTFKLMWCRKITHLLQLDRKIYRRSPLRYEHKYLNIS